MPEALTIAGMASLAAFAYVAYARADIKRINGLRRDIKDFYEGSTLLLSNEEVMSNPIYAEFVISHLEFARKLSAATGIAIPLLKGLFRSKASTSSNASHMRSETISIYDELQIYHPDFYRKFLLTIACGAMALKHRSFALRFVLWLTPYSSWGRDPRRLDALMDQAALKAA
jgi:hypothetical protein